MNKIVYGNIEFTNTNIISGNCNMSHALNGESLAIDTLTFKAWTGQEIENFITKNNNSFITKNGELLRVWTETVNPTQLTIGTPLLYYFKSNLIGKFFIDKINRHNNNTYTFSCISAVGILDRTMHYGGMYNGIKLKTLLEELLHGIDYKIDNSVEELKIYGYLPYAKKRDNLQQVQIATGIAVKTLNTGKLYITALSKNTVGNITKENAIVGGKYDRLVPASKLILTEHKYTMEQTANTIYKNAINGNITVVFKEPYHDLQITGGTIIKSGANYAEIKGNGAVVLIGKKYKHITQEITKGLENTNVKKVVKATLVTMVNSHDVLNRLYDAYNLNNYIEQEYLYKNERCGDIVEVINPYNYKTENACIKNLNINFGGFLKAKGKFILDFVPSQPSMGFSTKKIITNGNTFIVPNGITKLRVILIGGGTGGAGGNSGKNGIYADGQTIKYGGPGGAGGVGGLGGKVINTTLSVTPGQSLAYTIGTGGAGGTTDTVGQEGTNTIFYNVSTENGEKLGEYVDIFSGERYAFNGEAGVNGGSGSSKNKIGSSVSCYRCGQNGQDASCTVNGQKISATGGYGGGASNIANGQNGQDARCEYNVGKGFAEGGDGGNGATGGNGQNATTYGSGGTGGAGGGGGGAWGSGHGLDSSHQSDGNYGSGGAGGKGGNGANGCIIIYY